jgi:cephalosporin-C deacetylase-like acetyl esterase
MIKGLKVLAALVVAAAASSATAQPAAPVSGRQQLTAYLDAIATRQLEARRRTVAALSSPAQVERRNAEVRATILSLIGGVPEAGPLNATIHGVTSAEGFRLEKLTYESVPGYRVTANVFVPEGRGPFPAVIIAPGHGPDGKAGNYAWGANLARAGMLVLSYDVVGEGERWQHYDPETGESKAQRPTGEHSVDYWAVLPTGDHVARYFIADALRGVDYLVSRPDVAADRIGAFGCSGGGTVTSYLAALDPRVKATASACYINDYAHLLSGPGNQDAEQTLPWFIERGLDVADWIHLAAPRPYAIVSTTEDMFPFAGAKAAYEEVRRVYALYGAEDRLQWITGPGGHGALQPIAPEVVAFFTRWLRDDPTPRAFTALRPPRPEDVLVTPTGQLSTSLGGETIRSLNAKRARGLLAAPAQPKTPYETSALRTRLRRDIGVVTRTTARPGSAPMAAATSPPDTRDGRVIETFRLTSEPGITIDLRLSSPQNAQRTLVLLTGQTPPSLEAQVARLNGEGWRVLMVTLRGVGGTEEIKASMLGDWNLLAARAFLVGKTPIGMRIDDTIRALDWLAARDGQTARPISLYGVGGMGAVALHVAVLDERVGEVYADATVTSYREAVDRPLTRNMPEITPPGVLARYDLPDLVHAIAPRPVTLVAPVNGVGEPLREAEFERVYAAVLQSDEAMSTPGRVRWLPRGGRDPWPVLRAR